jgi:acetyltransferase-like isoleucine patch superfamily enzyme
VTFQTGTHFIGDHDRRAGKGYNSDIKVGNGCWIGVRSTILPGISIGDGSVVAACACVARDVEKDTLVGGVPAKQIRKLDYDKTNTEHH